jgi:hypothetical protein
VAWLFAAQLLDDLSTKVDFTTDIALSLLVYKLWLLLRFKVQGFKPALVRRNVLFKTVLINTMPRDSMKSTAKPGLGQGLENDEHKPV